MMENTGGFGPTALVDTEISISGDAELQEAGVT